MSAPSGLPWRFLTDEAIDQTTLDSFGVHSVYSKLLLKIVSNAQTPFSIALYSDWGTGKTSVAKMLRSLATVTKGIAVVYLDVWKYSSDPLKRWILLETEAQLRKSGAIGDYKFQNRSLQSHLEFEEQAEDESRVKVDFKTLVVLGVILSVTVATLVLLALFAPDQWKTNGVVNGIVVVISGFTFMAVLLASVVTELFKALSGMVFRRTVRHVTMKQAFSSEKFGEIFHNLVMTATKGSGSRILFIFDNLDRCPAGVAVEAIGVIKTYLDEPNCVYLIPCDESALVKHLSKVYVGDAEDAPGYAREFLNKFFQTTLRLPEASEFDIEKYLDDQLKAAKMDDLPNEARDVLVLGYLGQTPRQIKRVINDLIAFRALADEAEQSQLIERRTLTDDLPLLTKISVISVQWPDFLGRLAHDPELWSEIIDKINAGAKIENENSELIRFLTATRHVSPSSDVRPFVFLKRFDFDKDVKLSKQVEDILRKGESDKFEALMTEDTSASRQPAIAAKMAGIGRQWLAKKRQTFLKNAAPIFTKAALVISDHQLELLALDVLEHLASALSSEQFEDVINVDDVMQLDDKVRTHQKVRVVSSLVGLFGMALRGTDRRLKTWSSIIRNSNQLTSAQKSSIARSITERFDLKDIGQQETLAILDISSGDPAAFRWGVEQALFSKIAEKLDFEVATIETQRVKTLIIYQAQIGDDIRAELTKALAGRLKLPAKATDIAAMRARSYVTSFQPGFFKTSHSNELIENLIAQLEAADDTLKSTWAAPIFYLYGTMPPEARSTFEDNISQFISGPADPATLQPFLDEIGAENRKLLLSIPRVKVAVRSQPAYLERFGKAKAAPYRRDFLKSFSSCDLLDIDLFDDARVWDLANLLDAFGRAAATEGTDEESIRRHLARVCEEILLPFLPERQDLYDQVNEMVTHESRLLNEAVADVLCQCAIKLLATDIGVYYDQFKFWKSKLSRDMRVRMIRQALSEMLDVGDERLGGLDKLSEDIAGDEEVRQDQALIREIFDHCFVSLDEGGVAALGSSLNLLPFLAPPQLRDYIDRALDTLVTYQASNKPLDDMEPFCRLVESPAAHLDGNDVAKLTRFCRRMLGPANRAEEQSRAIQLVRTVKRPELVEALREELGLLSGSDATEIARAAKEVLGS
jgi:hypothetical protein